MLERSIADLRFFLAYAFKYGFDRAVDGTDLVVLGLDECFGLKWDDIFKHESFKFKYKSNFFPYSDERFALLKETYQHCKPEAEPPQESIQQAEKLYDEKKCQNPNLEKGKTEMKEKYDKYWGKGAYEKTFE